MNAPLAPHVLNDLIDTWEVQQNAYVRNRSERFRVIVDAIARMRPHTETILDIGAGLGSFTKLILQRFPEARVLALDYDPSLQLLARHNLTEYGNRVSLIEADLRDPSWPAKLGGSMPSAVVSSTALHWLESADLLRCYGILANLLEPGSLFFNADHLLLPSGTLLDQLASSDRHEHEQDAFGAGVLDWDEWWTKLRGTDGFADLVAERDRRFSEDGEDDRESSAALHLEALRWAGFSEAGTLWQYLDDYVVYAVR